MSTLAAQTAETQANVTPAIAKQFLIKGNQRFMDKDPLNRDLIQQVHSTTNGQYPYAVVLSCIDSRIPTEVVFDQGVGDIFNARVAGNFVNTDILGSIEFACKVAGSKLVVIMGHTSCGAVKGACDNVELGNLTSMLAKITPAVDATSSGPDEDRSSANKDFVNRVSKMNVEMTIKNTLEQSEVLREMQAAGEIEVVGAMYDVASGKVEFYD